MYNKSFDKEQINMIHIFSHLQVFPSAEKTAENQRKLTHVSCDANCTQTSGHCRQCYRHNLVLFLHYSLCDLNWPVITDNSYLNNGSSVSFNASV